jgi:aminoglycoside phosphotransferase (APT) family kinase protein
VIVHGDPGPGNALFSSETGLTVLDWEFGHVGDAAEDWAYLAYIRGRRIMSAEDWQQRLRELAHVDYSAEQWRGWLAFNHLRGAAVNLTARTIFERGPRRVADHLAIGVAVHLRFLSQLTDLID